MNIIKGLLWGLVAQIATFLQLQGQMKYEFLKNNTWLTVMLGMPISYAFMQSVKHIVTAYNGEIWPSRLLGFGLGVIVFTTMSHFLFKEPLTLKTIICLMLGCCIIGVQIFWK